jgi:hypothetical protein
MIAELGFDEAMRLRNAKAFSFAGASLLIPNVAQPSASLSGQPLIKMVP